MSVHYAHLLRDVSTETCQDLERFQQWAGAHPLKQSLLQQSRLPVWWHESLFQEFTQAHPNTTPSALSILRLLSQHKRLGLLSDILESLRRDRLETMEVYWHTARWLNPSEVSDFERLLEQKFGKPVVLHQKKRSDLVLGGILLWDDRMLDLSLFPVFSSLYHEAIHALTSS